jgi:hypothetical protein
MQTGEQVAPMAAPLQLDGQPEMEGTNRLGRPVHVVGAGAVAAEQTMQTHVTFALLLLPVLGLVRYTYVGVTWISILSTRGSDV